MSIELVKIIYDTTRDFDNKELCTYKYKSIDYCCEMFKNIGHVFNFDFKHNSDVYLIDREEREDDDGIYCDNEYKIKYCPFCGKPLDIKIVSEENHIDLCDKIIEKYAILERELSLTDSIKKSNLIEEQLDKLNSIYEYLTGNRIYSHCWSKHDLVSHKYKDITELCKEMGLK